ncbi:unnamed protein product [Moneuplotes crassus]|uniref:B9 domain-containing protein 1 n=2 Tax=Euplotes crassus TaxID=5936 RepID=A0AAD1XUB4_EUPCR|nr:unnamed protein product [Moneuplotes crassus]
MEDTKYDRDEEEGLDLDDDPSDSRDFERESKSDRRGRLRDFDPSEGAEGEDSRSYDRDHYSKSYSRGSLDRVEQEDQESEESEEEKNFFYMGVSGQILSGEFKDYDGLAIKYCFVSKGGWIMDKGTVVGISQHSFKSSGISKRIIWNFPFEIRYRSKTIKDWPQMVLYCSGKDFAGREVIHAYGNTHIPTATGRHTKVIKMFQPISSNILSKIMGFFKGKNPEYKDAPLVIAGAEGRELTRVKPNGLLRVSFQITIKEETDYEFK